MTTLKSLIMVSALLVGGAGACCATANELPDVGGWPPVAAAPGPAASIPARTARHHGTRHHRMYMMSVNRTAADSVAVEKRGVFLDRVFARLQLHRGF